MPIFTPEVRKELTEKLIDRMSTLCRESHCFADYETEEIACEDIAFECRADDYDCGCTKVVLYFDDIDDWVVKIPILGTYDCIDDIYYEYDHAAPVESDRPKDDYCAAEAWYYERAKEEGLEDFFAGTFFLGNFGDDVPVYVSERIDTPFWDAEDRRSNQSIQNSRIAQDMIDHNRDLRQEICFNSKSLGYLIDDYGLEQVELLSVFILIYNITDIHTGNIRIDDNGKTRIIDYSGYHREEWSDV